MFKLTDQQHAQISQALDKIIRPNGEKIGMAVFVLETGITNPTVSVVTNMETSDVQNLILVVADQYDLVSVQHAPQIN